MYKVIFAPPKNSKIYRSDQIHKITSSIQVVEEKWHQGWRLANLEGIVLKLSDLLILHQQTVQDWLTIKITSYLYPIGWDQMNKNRERESY